MSAFTNSFTRGLVQVGSNMNQPPAILKDGNTLAWYDYTNTETIIKDGSNKISRWNDLLGSGHDLLQANATKQPTLLASGVLFDGVDDVMSSEFTLTQPQAIYCIVKQLSWTNGDFFFDGIMGESMRVTQAGASPTVLSAIGKSINSFPIGEFGIIQLVVNGNNSIFTINNGSEVTGNFGASNAGGVTLGRWGWNENYFSNIEVKEIIIRKTADDATNRQLIYNYLFKKK